MDHRLTRIAAAFVAFLALGSAASAQSGCNGLFPAAGAICGYAGGSGKAPPSILTTLPTGVQNNITRAGTIVAGIWQATAVAPTYGGLGSSYAACSGVPLFTAGTSSCVASMGTGNFARADSSTFTNGAFNGTIGATTPSTIVATTVGIGVATSPIAAGNPVLWARPQTGDNLVVRGHQNLANGVTFDSVDNANTVNQGIEFRASPVLFAGGAFKSGNTGITGIAGCLTSDGATPANITAGSCGTGLPAGGAIGNCVVNTSAGAGNWFNCIYNLAAAAGVDCTGAANSKVAFDAAFTAAYTVYIPKGCTIALTADSTVPAGSTLIIEKGGLLNVAVTKTLTINGTCQFGIYQVFNGAGSVVGCKVNRPEWWPNCPNTGKTGAVDHAACITSAITSMMASTGSDGDKPTVLFSQGYGATPGYYVKSCINFKLSSAVNANYLGSGLSTQGANIVAASVANGFSGTCISQVTNTTSATSVNFSISGLHMVNDDPANNIRCMAVGEGTAAKRIEGARHSSIIQNVNCTNFPTGIRVVNTRLIVFDRVSVQLPTTGAATGMIWDVDTNGDFTGDIIVQNSQFECTYGQGQTGLRLRAEQGPSSSTGVTGGTFTAMTLYYCDKQVWISAAAGSNATDHVFTDNRWDGTFGVGLYMTTDNVAAGTLCSNRSCIENISINNLYMRGGTGVGLSLTAGKAESIKDVSVCGGYWNNASDRYVYVEKTTGFSIGCGLKMGLISGVTEAMYFTASASMLFNGINAANHGAGAQVTYAATIAGASDGWCQGSNNVYAWISSAFIQNSSSPGAGHTTCNAP